MRFFTTKKPNLTATTNKFNNRGPSSQSYDFSRSHVWMWELDHKESWVPKNQCFWTVVLEKTLKSPLDCKEIQPVHPKGDQSSVFIGRTDVEAETPVLWPPDVKSYLLEKTLMLGGIGSRKRRARQRMRLLDGVTDSMDMVWVDSGCWWWTGRPGGLQFMVTIHAAVHGVAKSRTLLSNWTELNKYLLNELLNYVDTK